MAHARKLFVNLAVRNLKEAMGFFSKLGFEFDRRFTDEKAACLIVGADTFFMLLTEPFFRSFTPREVCDTSRQTEGMFAVSCGSRPEVDGLTDQAIALGGSPAGQPQDHGFMYSRGFYDLDGHHWEVLWMDPNAPVLSR
ncbi:MAG: VOC family protein [Myxococcales bacterium]